ncbi:hypothetical protein GCM10009095_33010 [Sphingomonas molluscorum]
MLTSGPYCPQNGEWDGRGCLGDCRTSACQRRDRKYPERIEADMQDGIWKKAVGKAAGGFDRRGIVAQIDAKCLGDHLIGGAARAASLPDTLANAIDIDIGCGNHKRSWLR